MSSDPNNTRWSKSSKSFGKAVLQKAGWSEGEGLGKSQDGITQHVKVSKKDDVTGLGYQAGVGETWSAQSVGFADVLDRIKKKTTTQDSDESDEESAASASPVSSPNSLSGGRYYQMYAKRNALKTEGLHRDKEEILGLASKKRSRSDTSSSALDADAESTLHSPTLRRLMVRCPAAEPKISANDSIEEKVQVTKPVPRPPKCTESPFLLS